VIGMVVRDDNAIKLADVGRQKLLPEIRSTIDQ